jgi:hypothetical protein
MTLALGPAGSCHGRGCSRAQTAPICADDILARIQPISDHIGGYVRACTMDSSRTK